MRQRSPLLRHADAITLPAVNSFIQGLQDTKWCQTGSETERRWPWPLSKTTACQREWRGAIAFSEEGEMSFRSGPVQVEVLEATEAITLSRATSALEAFLQAWNRGQPAGFGWFADQHKSRPVDPAKIIRAPESMQAAERS